MSAARVKLTYRGLIGMHASALSQQFGKPICQRLQGHSDAADPLRERRANQRHALARRNLLEPIFNA